MQARNLCSTMPIVGAIQRGALKNKAFKLLYTTYDNNGTPIDISPWKKDTDLSTFKTKVVYHPETGEAVVSHKGTEGFHDWTYAKQIQNIAEEKYGANMSLAR